MCSFECGIKESTGTRVGWLHGGVSGIGEWGEWGVGGVKPSMRNLSHKELFFGHLDLPAILCVHVQPKSLC